MTDENAKRLTDSQMENASGGQEWPVHTSTCPYCGSRRIDSETEWGSGPYQGWDRYYCRHCHLFWYVQKSAGFEE